MNWTEAKKINNGNIPLDILLDYENMKLFGDKSSVYKNTKMLENVYKYADIIGDKELIDEAIYYKYKGIYGFDIDMENPDPLNRISYPDDVMNANYAPIQIGLDSSLYNLGDWKDAFFIKNVRPVMLRYDGTVDYELDHSNQRRRRGSTEASDINNTSYSGNAMVEFPKIYFKRWEDGRYQHVRLANYAVDSSYKCYQHMYNNKEIDKIYLPMFNGSEYGGKLRSLADRTPCTGKTLDTEKSYISANGSGWQCDDWINTMMVIHLLYLIGKTTDLQETFGRGYTDTSLPMDTTGKLANTGMFYGSDTYTKHMKVFWIEDFFVYRFDRKYGCMQTSDKKFCIKPYPPYDITGATGYTEMHTFTSTLNNDYISKTKMTEYGDIPISVGGTPSTFIPDIVSMGKTEQGFLIYGGTVNMKNAAGGMCMEMTSLPSSPYIGSSLSYKKPM